MLLPEVFSDTWVWCISSRLAFLITLLIDLHFHPSPDVCIQTLVRYLYRPHIEFTLATVSMLNP